MSVIMRDKISQAERSVLEALTALWKFRQTPIKEVGEASNLKLYAIHQLREAIKTLEDK